MWGASFPHFSAGLVFPRFRSPRRSCCGFACTAGAAGAGTASDPGGVLDGVRSALLWAAAEAAKACPFSACVKGHCQITRAAAWLSVTHSRSARDLKLLPSNQLKLALKLAQISRRAMQRVLVR